MIQSKEKGTATLVRDLSIIRYFIVTPPCLYQQLMQPGTLCFFWCANVPLFKVNKGANEQCRFLEVMGVDGDRSIPVIGLIHEKISDERIAVSVQCCPDHRGSYQLEIYNSIHITKEGARTKVSILSHIVRAAESCRTVVHQLEKNWLHTLDHVEWKAMEALT